MSNTFKIKNARKINKIYNQAKFYANGTHFNVIDNFNSKLEELINKSEFKNTPEIVIRKFLKIVENNSTNNHRKGISKVKKVEKRLMKRSERQSVYKEIQNYIEFSEEI